MKRCVFNSAVITAPGLYQYFLINEADARAWLKQGPFDSYLGYQETADALEALTGVRAVVSRASVKMQPGDEALVFRLVLPVRVHPQSKGRLTPEFIIAHCEIGLLVRKE